MKLLLRIVLSTCSEVPSCRSYRQQDSSLDLSKRMLPEPAIKETILTSTNVVEILRGKNPTLKQKDEHSTPITADTDDVEDNPRAIELRTVEIQVQALIKRHLSEHPLVQDQPFYYQILACQAWEGPCNAQEPS